MKSRISATIDKKTEQILKEILTMQKYRNKSHIIEEAIKNLLEVDNDKNKK